MNFVFTLSDGYQNSEFRSSANLKFFRRTSLKDSLKSLHFFGIQLCTVKRVVRGTSLGTVQSSYSKTSSRSSQLTASRLSRGIVCHLQSSSEYAKSEGKLVNFITKHRKLPACWLFALQSSTILHFAIQPSALLCSPLLSPTLFFYYVR